ncbi:MAG TPA: ATP-binding protein [Acidimicrobiales bacterium]|nr:ATP-binding protein [Acidimicrobiales bacterium]
MRRLEQRRLEAALSHLRPPVVVPGDEPASIDELIGLLESAAATTERTVERQEQLSSRLSAALDALTVGVVVCDEHGEEVFRNLAAGRKNVLRPADALVDQVVREALAGARQGQETEQPLELFSPYRRNLMIRAYPIAAATGPLGAVAVVEDISERRRLDAIRRDFVANVSHELKTPVGALSLLAETLDGEEDPEVVARLAARVGAEAERLGRIIDDLLDLSRIEANEGQRDAPIDVGRMVDDAIEPLRTVAEAGGITLEASIPSAPVVISGDRLDLVSAVANLVDNAVKYSEPGGSVHVELAVDGDVVRISVRDEGIGIPRRDRERVFERFYRVDRARSRLTGGTGLGLSIVRHVAANHGGRVELQSEEGVGSTFTLVLPIAHHPVKRLLGEPAEGEPSGAGAAGPGAATGDSLVPASEDQRG